MVEIPTTLNTKTSMNTAWLGYLQLCYRLRGGRTVLAHRRHQGPLLVQRSFHPEGDVCHSYIIHPPGGVVGGDRLQLEVNVEPGAHALLTTPAAAKFYRSAGALAHQQQTFTVAAGASLEFLPMETILHGRSRTALYNSFRLGAGARLCAWDIVCLGRPGSGDHFEQGDCLQDLVIEREGVRLVHERLNLVHGDPLLTRPWGLGGHPAIGTLVATPAPESLEGMLREAVTVAPGLHLGITRIGDVLLLRCLGPGAEAVRGVLEQSWALLREPIMDRVPVPPRIWKT